MAMLAPTANGAAGFGMPPSSARAKMSGKKLFTCSQCGAMLKFLSHADASPFKERLEGLRPAVPIEETGVEIAPPSDLAATPGAAAMQQCIAHIPELVWELQEQGPDYEAEWRPAPVVPTAGLAPFVSANRGTRGSKLERTIPNRLLSKPQLWLSDGWDIDLTVEGCDSDGWVYASAWNEMPSVTGEPQQAPVDAEPVVAVRRRRHIRKRQTDGSELSWFVELLDCNELFLQKKLPTCHDCEQTVIRNLEQTLSQLECDQEQFEAFLNDFLGEDANESDECGVDSELRALEEEERQLRGELASVEDETQIVVNRRRELWSTARDLEHMIRGTFGEGAFLQHMLGLSRDERQSVSVTSVYTAETLGRLQRYNVCNDVFHIWHDDTFGTINGLRLGRLPTRPVEWYEINAALGFAVLLLATIAERAAFQFTKNKLMPRGSYSRVESPYGKQYSLYSDGSIFRRGKFNQALVLFLECVGDAGKRAKKEEPTLQFPYEIQSGKIQNLSISLGNDGEWTKALKYMLTYLKFLLAWVARRYP